MIHSKYRALTLFNVFMFYCEDTPALITRVVLPSVIYFYCCLEGAELGQSAAFSVRWSTHSLCILSWIFLFCTFFFFFKYSFVWWVFCDSVPNKAILGSALHSRCTKQRSYSLFDCNVIYRSFIQFSVSLSRSVKMPYFFGEGDLERGPSILLNPLNLVVQLRPLAHLCLC